MIDVLVFAAVFVLVVLGTFKALQILPDCVIDWLLGIKDDDE